MEFLDMHGRIVSHGVEVEIQHCVGLYGQTQKVRGRVVTIDQYGGVRLLVNGRHQYIPKCFSYDFESQKMVGYGEHKGFEHEHTFYCKILVDE